MLAFEKKQNDRNHDALLKNGDVNGRCVVGAAPVTFSRLGYEPVFE